MIYQWGSQFHYFERILHHWQIRITAETIRNRDVNIECKQFVISEHEFMYSWGNCWFKACHCNHMSQDLYKLMCISQGQCKLYLRTLNRSQTSCKLVLNLSRTLDNNCNLCQSIRYKGKRWAWVESPVCTTYNQEFLKFILDELMPWHLSGHYYSTLEVNRLVLYNAHLCKCYNYA